MNTITIPKKEYRKLLEFKKKFSALATLKRGKFNDSAFGLLKKSFGTKPSVYYISKLRKKWG